MLKIGVFFGGPAREREISFAGGKTAIDNIDKLLFEPIPVFVDGLGNFILLKPALIYAPSIRDFFPPLAFQQDYRVYSESLEHLEKTIIDEMIAQVGVKILPHQFSEYFDFAFIAMHGPACEDGSIQGLLEWYGLPYSGPSLLGSSIGIDKIAQNDLIKLSVGLNKKTFVLSRQYFECNDKSTVFEEIKSKIGLPFVVKAPHQGSSIGVAFVKKDDALDFEKAVKQCLFIYELDKNTWITFSEIQQKSFLQSCANLDEGVGFPLVFEGKKIAHPAIFEKALTDYFSQDTNNNIAKWEAYNSENAVLIEAFVSGQEFSCGVVQTPDGQSVALPPTEIKPAVEVFDFKAKYQSNTTRKNIPINTSLANNEKVQSEVRKAFDDLKFGVCTRIDGFLTPDDQVILHDPNTIPGMSPSSLIFKQMAEIGLNVTDAITYFIRQSLFERMKTAKNTFQYKTLLAVLDENIATRVAGLANRQTVALYWGGNTSEAKEKSYSDVKIAYSKIAASTLYLARVFYVEDINQQNQATFTELPINLLFKESATDVDRILQSDLHPLILSTREIAKSISLHFTGVLLMKPQKLTFTDTQIGMNFYKSFVQDIFPFIDEFAGL